MDNRRRSVLPIGIPLPGASLLCVFLSQVQLRFQHGPVSAPVCEDDLDGLLTCLGKIRLRHVGHRDPGGIRDVGHKSLRPESLAGCPPHLHGLCHGGNGVLHDQPAFMGKKAAFDLYLIFPRHRGVKILTVR